MSVLRSKHFSLPIIMAVLGNLSAVQAGHPLAGHSTSPRFAATPPAQPALPVPDGANTPLLAANEPVLTPEAPQLAAAEAPRRSDGDAAPRRSVSESVTINLINRLVAKGVLTKEDSADLMRMAEQDATEARSQQAAAQQEAVNAAVMAAQREARAVTTAPDMMPQDDSQVRVTYVPEVVKQEMREQIKQDVMEQARNERWAAPRMLPEWVTKVRLFGDVRVRYQGDFFPDGNDTSGAFPNFNAINTGAPFDTSGTVFAPQVNANADRDRFRLRLRIGAEVDLNYGFSIGLRIATGETNTPVSTNQTLGLANNTQGGLFSKYNIWLDRGFLKYEVGSGDRDLQVIVGRFDNPFFTSEVNYDEDVGFDGAALMAKYGIGYGVVPFLTLGAFPIFNTDFNFGSNNPAKYKSTDKYLYAGQLGADWNINKDFHMKLAGAYYYYDSIEGRLSDPFVPLSPSDQGNTDDTRTSFSQRGNTYMALRNIIPTAANNFGTTNQYQYYGLASPFHVLAFTGRLDYNHFEPFRISLFGEFLQNLAFDQNDVDKRAVNNRGPDRPSGAIGKFAGGGSAWIVDLRAGAATLDKLGKFAVGTNYRYVESDAVVDGLTDSDFGGGGTNLRGYQIYGVMALTPNVTLGARWMSSREIAGPPFREDTFILDLTGRF